MYLTFLRRLSQLPYLPTVASWNACCWANGRRRPWRVVPGRFRSLSHCTKEVAPSIKARPSLLSGAHADEINSHCRSRVRRVQSDEAPWSNSKSTLSTRRAGQAEEKHVSATAAPPAGDGRVPLLSRSSRGPIQITLTKWHQPISPSHTECLHGASLHRAFTCGESTPSTSWSATIVAL